MKDMNFIEINQDLNHTLINFPEDKVDYYSSIIEKDSIFLLSHGLMDYSLLLVVEFTC